ncbi:hypothetical protein [Ruminococcus sp.]|nr:hypothetical protein [uncultured Ruminococcus sp.]
MNIWKIRENVIYTYELPMISSHCSNNYGSDYFSEKMYSNR